MKVRALARVAAGLLAALVTVLPLAVAPAPAGAATTSTPTGYWMAFPSGRVLALDGAVDYGSITTPITAPIVGLSPTATRKGYWLVGADGAVYSFGDAGFFGSMGGHPLNRPVVGMSPTATGKGYWLFAGDGGIFAFGDAAFFGSTGSIQLNKPIVGMVPTSTGKGYWMVATDGGIFAYGDAAFHGSTGSIRLNQPIVAMSPGTVGQGYWLVAADGGVFAFDVPFVGSLGGQSLSQPVVEMLPANKGLGYWVVTQDGSSFPFGKVSGTVTSTSTTALSPKPPAFGVLYTPRTKGDQAVQFALAQLGKPYEWAGTGPDTFDCSGLTLRAWQSVGVTIPRVANDQYDGEPHVPLDQLQPGDLVFFATDTSDSRSVHHVGIYIGNHHMINAPYTGAFVRPDNVGGSELMPFGARPA